MTPHVGVSAWPSQRPSHLAPVGRGWARFCVRLVPTAQAGLIKLRLPAGRSRAAARSSRGRFAPRFLRGLLPLPSRTVERLSRCYRVSMIGVPRTAPHSVAAGRAPPPVVPGSADPRRAGAAQFRARPPRVAGSGGRARRRCAPSVSPPTAASVGRVEADRPTVFSLQHEVGRRDAPA